MGVCLSRCGDAQQKAGVVAATISHQNSLVEPVPNFDVSDPNQSLKTFLHLYGIAESSSKRSFSSPRPSLGEAFYVPHSSELFSLPDSDADRSSCCTPARTSRASISSRPTTISSPKSTTTTRHSFSVWGGRFSTDRSVSMGCRKKIRPARSSKGGELDVAAHQRLVEAIARLERLNNGKNLGLRGSSFHRSDLEGNPRQLLTKSRSGEIKRPSCSSSGRHHHHHHHHRHAAPQPVQETSKSRDDQSNMNRAELDEIKLTFPPHKMMGNLVSMAGPIIKQRPLEKSVTDFLKEVENFVSLIEAPRLSLSSDAALRESLNDEPLIITTYSRSDQEDSDSDDQFTFFEATFASSDSCKNHNKTTSDVVTSLQPAARPVCTDELTKSVCDEGLVVTETQVTSPRRNSVKKATPEKSKNLSIYEDLGIEAKRTGKVLDVARPVLTEVDMNVVPSTIKKSPVSIKSPVKVFMKASRVFRRGLSRSLDSRDQSTSTTTKLDFNVFKSGSTQVAPVVLLVCNDSEGSRARSTAEGGGLIEATSTELESVQDSEGKVGQQGSEEQGML